MKTILSTQGRLLLPADLRKRDGILPGQSFAIRRLRAGVYEIRRKEPPAKPGLVAWLKACPTKEFFHPIPSDIPYPP